MTSRVDQRRSGLWAKAREMTSPRNPKEILRPSKTSLRTSSVINSKIGIRDRKRGIAKKISNRKVDRAKSAETAKVEIQRVQIKAAKESHHSQMLQQSQLSSRKRSTWAKRNEKVIEL